MNIRRGVRLLPLLAACIVLISACGTNAPAVDDIISVENVPAFDGETAYVAINHNQPDFSADDLVGESYELYSELDWLGRCGTAMACVGTDIMPTEERGAIGNVKPSGWHTVKYDIVDGKYLYNRCHLIGYQLTGENANEKNLITGTRFLNIEGMLPFENMIADYVKETGNHVIYRVTPIFDGDNLVARGVQMEAMSVEDDGEGVCFNVYAYNAQPGVSVNYVNGESKLGYNATFEDDASSSASQTNVRYVLNLRTKTIHIPTCDSVDDTAPHNRSDTTESIDDLTAKGYKPCKKCNP